MTNKVKKIIELLELEPLQIEGGFFRQTYRSNETISKDCLSKRYKSKRVLSTAIYYLLTPETFSSLHKLPTDEIFHFYAGDIVEMLQLFEDGTGKIIQIGNKIEDGFYPQVVVPNNTWQGARLIEGGEFALFGATMAPGFDVEDFVEGTRNELIKIYPAFSDMITKLTV